MSWLTRLRNAFHPRRLDDDLAEEIRDHLERRTAELRRGGLSEAEARRQSAQRFGNEARVREESRALRLWPVVEETIQDLRYAWRGLLRNRIFALVAVVSLGLAMGANTAIYSIVEAALLRPLPVRGPEQLFVLSAPGQDGTGLFSYPLFEALRSAAAGRARLGLFGAAGRVEAQADGADGPFEKVTQQMVSADAFAALDVKPALGALFSPEVDHFPGPRAVVVLSHEYWLRRFNGDPAILGRRLILEGRTFTVLGVASRGFSGPETGKFIDVWLPVTTGDSGLFTNPDVRLFHLLGRLAPGTSRAQLAASLQAVFHQHQLERIESRSGLPAVAKQQMQAMPLLVQPGADGLSSFRQDFAGPLWILLGVSLCMLLIASANVASLLLARSNARSAEMALRVSLGAGRVRLVRQLLTESLLIALLAGGLGWVLARVAGPVLVGLVSTLADPVQFDLRPSLQVLLFCGGLCAASAVFFGLLPAWQATRVRPAHSLRHDSGQVGRLRLGRLFVSVQVAFSFCLVAGGAGFLLSLRNLTSVDPGFDPAGITVLSMNNTNQRNLQLEWTRQLEQRLAAQPNVQGATAAWMAVFSGARRAQRIVLPGSAPSEREETFYRVDPGYLATFKTPLLAGRDLRPTDNDNEPVATVVNRAFAQRYFGTDAVLGREFRRDDGALHQIVGLAGDSRFGSLRGGPEPIVYMPMKPPRWFTLYVRSTLDPVSVAALVDREAQAIGAGLRVRDAVTLDALIGSTIRRERLLAFLGGTFAGLALLLATIGIFGLLNYAVARRTREMGIRTALGAQRLPIFGLVVKDLAGMVGGGLCAGVAGSVVWLRLTRSLLFGVPGTDPWLPGATLAIFLLASVVAMAAPAWRAVTVDPVRALRHE